MDKWSRRSSSVTASDGRTFATIRTVTASDSHAADEGGVGRPERRGGLIILASVLLAALTAGHRLVPNVRGLGSLVDTVTPLLGLGIPPLVLAALLRRTRGGLVAVLVPALTWAALFGVDWLPARGGPAHLRVVSQNLRADSADPAATVRELARTDADLIGLQEVSAGMWAPVADTLAAEYPYEAAVSTVGLRSRFPIREYVGVNTGLAWTRGLRAVVAVPGGDVVVYVVHLGSARPAATAIRDHTVMTFAAVLRRDAAQRLIVLGDLNTASTDRVITPLTDLLADAQADAGRGPGFTWPAGLPLTRPDHILYRGLTAVSADVVHTPASDHRAVTAGFR